MTYLINALPVKKMGAFIQLSYLLIGLVFAKANKATLSGSDSYMVITIDSRCDEIASRSLHTMNPKSGIYILTACYRRFRRTEKRG